MKNEILTKCSPRLQEVLRRGDTNQRELQVMLRSDLTPEAQGAAVRELARVTGEPVETTFGIVSVHAPVHDAARIAAFDDVEWIDLASEASLEELLDSE